MNIDERNKICKTLSISTFLYFRTDIIEDTGSSLSPEIDIGQIEGAFIFGLGLWTSEEIKFHPTTGKILTFDTWVRCLFAIF